MKTANQSFCSQLSTRFNPHYLLVSIPYSVSAALLSLLVCLLSPITVRSHTNLDSLYSIWQDKTQPDSTRVAAFSKYISKGFLFSRPDSAGLLAGELVQFGINKNYPKACAAGYNTQGISWSIRGDYPKAHEFYNRSLDVYEALGDQKATANVLNNIGIIYLNQGDYPKALEIYHQCLDICEQIGDQDGMADVLNNLGLVHYDLGDYSTAREYYTRILKIYEKSGDKRGLSGVLNNIGLIYHDQGKYPIALEYYTQSLAIEIQLGGQRGIANSYLNIGGIYSDLGYYIKAIDNYVKSLKINEQLGNLQGIAQDLLQIGLTYQKQNDYPEALEYYTRCLKIFQDLGSQNDIAGTLKNIGFVYAEQGDFFKALDYYDQSLNIHEKTGDQKGISALLNNIGMICNEQGDRTKALDYFKQSLDIQEQLGNQAGIAASQINIGKVYRNMNNHPKSVDYCKRGYVSAVNLGILESQKNACECLYGTYKAMGVGNKALEYMELFNLLKDSLQVEATTKALQHMEFQKVILQDSIAKAEEARMAQVALNDEVRKQKHTRNIGLGMGGLFVLLTGGLFGRIRYARKSRAILQVEKDRSEHLLLNILPAEIAAELKQKGRADARDFETVSILFTDFIGFTEQSSKLSASDLVRELNHCFEGFDNIAEKYGIEKIKTIGDSYMAAGGLPIPTEGSLKNTVLAALEMQALISNRKSKNHADGKIFFEMRVGIHTGPVVAGIVGVKKFQYDIWGDTVNTASRMESNGEVGMVNISEATYELLKNDPDFSFKSRGKITVKGKGEMEMYFVKGKKGDVGRL